mmetsp:Transcript_17662/g.40996  ORF Transcript_17662/g.40996 Transcript_17662/m.40996 type:complete len:141 (-) Transcript_17662:59-481(-)
MQCVPTKLVEVQGVALPQSALQLSVLLTTTLEYREFLNVILAAINRWADRTTTGLRDVFFSVMNLNLWDFSFLMEYEHASVTFLLATFVASEACDDGFKEFGYTIMTWSPFWKPSLRKVLDGSGVVPDLSVGMGVSPPSC